MSETLIYIAIYTPIAIFGIVMAVIAFVPAILERRHEDIKKLKEEGWLE